MLSLSSSSGKVPLSSRFTLKRSGSSLRKTDDGVENFKKKHKVEGSCLIHNKDNKRILEKCTASINAWCHRQQTIRSFPIEFDDNPEYTNIEKQILNVWRRLFELFESLTDSVRFDFQQEVFDAARVEIKVGYWKNKLSYPLAHDVAYDLLKTVKNKTLEFDAFAIDKLTKYSGLDENEALKLQEEYFHAVFQEKDFKYEDDDNYQEKDKNGKTGNSHVNDGSENGCNIEGFMKELEADGDSMMSSVYNKYDKRIQEKCTASINAWCHHQETIRSLPIKFDDNAEYTNIEKQILRVWRKSFKLFESLTDSVRFNFQQEVFDATRNEIKVGYLKSKTSYPLAYDIAYDLLKTVTNKTLQLDAFAINKLTEFSGLDENQVFELQMEYFHSVFQEEDFKYE